MGRLVVRGGLTSNVVTAAIVVALVPTIVFGLRASEASQAEGTPSPVVHDDLAARVSALERRVAALEASTGTTASGSLMATPVSARGSLSLTGAGQTALDPFDLPAGLYKFSATCDNGFFNIEFAPLAGDEYVSISLVGSAPYSGSDNVEVAGGRYAMSVSCGGNWTVTAEPVR